MTCTQKVTIHALNSCSPATKNMNILTVARHPIYSIIAFDWSCIQVSVISVRRVLAGRSDETKIWVGRYMRALLGRRDTWDAASPRLIFPTKSPCATSSTPWSMKNPFTIERGGSRLFALIVPRSPIHVM
jgi:hypothetical protein